MPHRPWHSGGASKSKKGPKQRISKPKPSPGASGPPGRNYPVKSTTPKSGTGKSGPPGRNYPVSKPTKSGTGASGPPGRNYPVIPPKNGEDKGSTAANVVKGLSVVATGAGVVKAKKTIADIRKINKWADRVNRKFGKSYIQLGKKVNPALMARTSGEFIPSKIFGKTGYPAGIKNWWMARSSPVHFAGAEKFVNPALKTVGGIVSRASLPIAVVTASYGATNFLMNNTFVGQAVKDKAYNFGYQLGNKLHDINQKLKNFSLISSAQAGELNIYSPETMDVTKQSRAGGAIPSIEEETKSAPYSFDIKVTDTQEIAPEKTKLLNEFNTFKDSGKVLNMSKQLAGAMITGDIELETQITDKSSINFKIGNWGNNMSVMYNIQLGG